MGLDENFTLLSWEFFHTPNFFPIRTFFLAKYGAKVISRGEISHGSAKNDVKGVGEGAHLGIYLVMLNWHNLETAL